MNILNSETYQGVFEVLKKALWNSGRPRADWAAFEEMKKHTVAALAGPILQELDLPDDLFQEWEKLCVLTFTRFQRVVYAQKNIPISVPYTILKGTSAAKY